MEAAETGGSLHTLFFYEAFTVLVRCIQFGISKDVLT